MSLVSQNLGSENVVVEAVAVAAVGETTLVAVAAPVNHPKDGGGGWKSLKQAAMWGSVWTIGGYGATQVLKFGSNLVLTRLLFPEIFGLMSLVSVFMQGLQMFSDVGIGPSIIQNKRGDDPLFLNTAWTIQVCRGFLLFLGSCALGWPAAHFYHEPRLIFLLPATGVSALIAGLTSTSIVTLGRHLGIAKVMVIELLCQLSTIATMILWAWISPTVWSLIAGGIAGMSVKVLICRYGARGRRNHFCWDRESAAELFGFGRWIFISTILTYLAMQSDRLILGRLIPLTQLGILSIAMSLAFMPRTMVFQLANKVIFPSLSRLAHLPRAELRAKIEKNRAPLLYGLAILVALAASVMDVLVRLIYDKRYVEASWMVPILMLGLWPRMLEQTINESLTAIGRLQYNPIGSVGRLIFVAVGVPLAFHHGGIGGAVVVIALADVPNYLADMCGLWKNGLLCMRQDLLASCLLVAVLGIGLWIRHLAGLPTPFAGFQH
jgi:O-antigen/teichoic acid export membrane protein